VHHRKLLAVCTLLMLCCPGTAPAALRTGDEPAARAAERVRAELDQDDFLDKLNRATRRIAEAVEPSVVHVSIGMPRRRGMGMARLASGSGWIYDDRGHIVTNAHVVEEAPRIQVQFNDGRQMKAELVGADAATDIAVIRVENPENLLPARRASGQFVRQGERVYAFGSPFGFKFSMSEGIISGVSRDPSDGIASEGYTNFIQSDAAVNPGNSGGPLVDIRGRVVGMNAAIATGSNPRTGGPMGQSAGISFAIPLATIEPVVAQLIATGKVVKGFLGINMPINEEDNVTALEEQGFKGQGVAIAGVVAAGPAEVAGVEKGDVVTAVNGADIANIAQLRTAIAFTPPGQAVNLRVWRKGAARDVKVTLGDLDQTRTAMATDALQRFGILDYRPSDAGVLIAAVRRGSPAEKAGFVTGTQITHINGLPLQAGSSLVAALGEASFPDRAALCIVLTPEGDEKDLQMKLDR
jgi:S1-C subfamily serine protease